MRCPHCDDEVHAGDRYCEACGYDLVGGGAPGSPEPEPEPVPLRWLSSARAERACPECGGTSFGEEGYCDGCGKRPATGREHSELDLDVIAAASDIGHRHRHNEDAVGIGLLPGIAVVVVCDGVSSSDRPDTASYAAVDAAVPALLDALRDEPGEPDRALRLAAGAAQAAAALAAGTDPGPNPPSSTFVAAVVTAETVTVGWVGDSRAYWLPDQLPGDAPTVTAGRAGAGTGTVGLAPVCLTTDDNVAGASGLSTVERPAGAAGALVRWLGADAGDTAPHLSTVRPSAPGRVLVCSDGLFRYRPNPVDLAAATPTGTPIEVARALVDLALAAGGEDNVSVAVLPFPAPDARTTRTEP
jgi:serine/threonine protein phosphatase PrpC